MNQIWPMATELWLQTDRRRRHYTQRQRITDGHKQAKSTCYPQLQKIESLNKPKCFKRKLTHLHLPTYG